MCETEANIVNGHRCVGPRSVHCLRGDALSLSDAKDGVERFTVDVLNKKNIMSKDSVRRPTLSSFAAASSEETNWGREVSSTLVRVGAGVLMVHNGRGADSFEAGGKGKGRARTFTQQLQSSSPTSKLSNCFLLFRFLFAKKNKNT